MRELALACALDEREVKAAGYPPCGMPPYREGAKSFFPSSPPVCQLATLELVLGSGALPGDPWSIRLLRAWSALTAVFCYRSGRCPGVGLSLRPYP